MRFALLRGRCPLAFRRLLAVPKMLGATRESSGNLLCCGFYASLNRFVFCPPFYPKRRMSLPRRFAAWYRIFRGTASCALQKKAKTYRPRVFVRLRFRPLSLRTNFCRRAGYLLCETFYFCRRFFCHRSGPPKIGLSLFRLYFSGFV